MGGWMNEWIPNEWMNEWMFYYQIHFQLYKRRMEQETLYTKLQIW